MKLIIFDLDGTLVHPFTSDFEPGVLHWFKSKRRGQKLAIATNQGGVGLRHWREVVRAEGGDIGDPNANGWTQASIEERVNSIAQRLGATPYMSFAYQSKKGHWSPTPEGAEGDPRWSQAWRKPQPGMLLQAMRDAGVTAENTLMVGNSDSDADAAAAAGIAYQTMDEFFAEHRPQITITYNPDRIWTWLGDAEGLNKAATMARYEAMLREAGRVYGHKVHIKTKAALTGETVSITRADSGEHKQSVTNFIGRHINDQWINREWVEFDTPEQHIDSLIAGEHIQQLVIIDITLRHIYGDDAYNRCKPKIKQAKAVTSRYKLVLG